MAKANKVQTFLINSTVEIGSWGVLGSGIATPVSPNWDDVGTFAAQSIYAGIEISHDTAEKQRCQVRDLIAEWRRSKEPDDDVADVIYKPSYQRLIGKGKLAVPEILRALEEEPDHWFWALYCITEEDPVPPEHEGMLDAMTADWLDWGKRLGYA